MVSWREPLEHAVRNGRKWAESLFPSVCIICGRTGRPSEAVESICPSCLAGLPWRSGNEAVLPVLSNRLRVSMPLSDFRQASQFRVLVPLHYSGPVPGLLRQLKFSGHLENAGPLGQLMAMVCQVHPLKPFDCIAAVPLHPNRLRERGYNQAGELVSAAAGRLGLPDLSAGFHRLEDTRRQSELSYEMRTENLRQAFQAEEFYFARRHVLVADDILTSGSTLWSAMEAVMKAGAASVTGLACASGRKTEDTRTDLSVTSTTD